MSCVIERNISSFINLLLPGSGDELEIKLPDEGNPSVTAPVPSNMSTPAATDLNSRLSGFNYDSFQTPNKEGYSISEFLTKMAHGEEVDVDSFISGGGDRKRRRLSGNGYDPSTGGLYDTPQPRSRDPWSDATSQPPVPDVLAWVSSNIIIIISYHKI